KLRTSSCANSNQFNHANIQRPDHKNFCRRRRQGRHASAQRQSAHPGPDDEFSEMKRQALKINGWGKNVYVKIPITNTRGESSLPLIHELAGQGVKLNVTAILTLAQVEGVT